MYENGFLFMNPPKIGSNLLNFWYWAVATVSVDAFAFVQTMKAKNRMLACACVCCCRRRRCCFFLEPNHAKLKGVVESSIEEVNDVGGGGEREREIISEILARMSEFNPLKIAPFCKWNNISALINSIELFYFKQSYSVYTYTSYTYVCALVDTIASLEIFYWLQWRLISYVNLF